MKILIYIPTITSRNRYVIKTIFKTYLRYHDFELTQEWDQYKAYDGPKFSYSSKGLEDKVQFVACGLLEEKGINEQNISLGKHNGVLTLFEIRRESALPYDPFAAVFYMISRYEEYLPHLRDKYDRYTAKESLAKKHDFLYQAVVDRWVMQLKDILVDHYPRLRFPDRKFDFIPTIDIDNAFAFKEKGFLRSLASLVRSIIKGELNLLLHQIQVISRRKKDPFDTYDYQMRIQKKYKLKPTYFFLLGDYGLNDKNLSHENRTFQSLVRNLADYSKVGIHPSYGSNSKTGQLKREIKRLERMVNREVSKSRQHFLKLRLPETYRNLIEEDIREDYTMGFASDVGFRSGTCTPYPFYDLDEEVECKLTVYPFQLMESTLKYYLDLPINESIQLSKRLIDEVKSVEGTFISLWHNESLSDQMEWIGWRKVYEEVIEYACSKKA